MAEKTQKLFEVSPYDDILFLQRAAAVEGLKDKYMKVSGECTMDVLLKLFVCFLTEQQHNTVIIVQTCFSLILK